MVDSPFDAAEELLATRMYAVGELIAELRRRGHRVEDDEDFPFAMTEREYWHFGDVLARPEHLLRERVFTHVITADEADGDYLSVDPDLVALTLDDARTFEIGPDLFDDDFEPEVGAVLRPRDGRLPWPVGTPVALRWLDAGRLSAEPVTDDLRPDPATVDAIRDAAAPSVGGDRAAMLLNVVGTVLAERPDVFASPQAPITDLLAAAELERHGDEVARQGLDWEARTEKRRADRVERMAREYGMPEDQARRFDRIQSVIYKASSAADSFDHDEHEVAAAVAEILDALGHDGRIDSVFVSWFNGLAYRLPGIVARRTLVDAAIATGRRLPPAIHMLRATIAEQDGDAIGHEAAVRDALRADPRFVPALVDAQWIAAERGDASRALTLLHDSAEPAQREELETLGWYASPGPMAAGRNDPCPCGSGRKYKQCCARHNGHALDDRFTWRLLRAAEFVQRPAQRSRLIDFVRAALGGHGGERAEDEDLAPALLFVGTQHPALVWLYLAEGGGLQRYLDERGSLFPDDERELVRSWLPARHRLLRFDEQPAKGRPADLEVLVPVVEVVSGERIEVPALQGSDRPQGGEVALGLVLSDGTRPRLTGFPIAVAPDRVEPAKALLSTDSPDGATLAGLLVGDELRDLAAGIEERYGDLGLDEHDLLDHLDGSAFDDYLDRLELVLELLGDVDEDEVLGRDVWDDDRPLSDDDLFALMTAAHPELEETIDSGEEVEVGGEAMSPRLHVAMHTIAARQILDGTPPATYHTALRLLEDGYDLHDVMHMLSRVVSNYAYAAIKDGTTPDDDEYSAALDALPGDWEHERHRIGAQQKARSRRSDRHRGQR